MLTIYHNQYTSLSINDQESLQVIDIFSTWKGSRKIELGEGSRLNYLFIATQTCEVTLDFQTMSSGAKATICGLCLATTWSEITIKVNAYLRHDSSEANIHLVSFIGEWGKCVLDGGVILEKNITQGIGHLLEENILLGKDLQIKTLPMLDVRSSDVQATHGATIQRLDSEKLFYLTSKWIPLSESKKLMIWSYFDRLFEIFTQNAEATEIKEKYLMHLLKTL